MTLGGRPLLDNAVDNELFVNRDEELAALYFGVEHGFNTLLSGDPGVGRTSLLRTLMYRARTARVGGPIGDYDMTYVRAEGIVDAAGLIEQVAQHVLGASTEWSRSAPAEGLLDALKRHREEAVQRTYDRWRAEGSSADGARFTSVIVLDDVTASAGHGLFGRLRDELWEIGYTWVVGVRSSDRAALLMPPADAFFEQDIHLGPLSLDAAVDMVSRRTGSHADAWARPVADAVGGNPRRVLEAARSLIGPDGSFDEFEPLVEAIRRRDQAVAALGRPEAMLAAELAAVGAASASDDALLAAGDEPRLRNFQDFYDTCDHLHINDPIN